MESIIASAGQCHEQGDRLYLIAKGETDKTKRRLLIALSDQYYMLHNQIVELERYLVGTKASTPAN